MSTASDSEFGQTRQVLCQTARVLFHVQAAAHGVGQRQQTAVGDASQDVESNLRVLVVEQRSEQIHQRNPTLAGEQIEGVEYFVGAAARQALA